VVAPEGTARSGLDLAGPWLPLQAVRAEVFAAARRAADGDVPPRQLLNEVRAAGPSARWRTQLALLDRLGDVLADEAAVERAVVLAGQNRLDEAEDLVAPMVSRLPDGELRARALDAHGRVQIWRGDRASAEAGSACLQQAFEAYARLGLIEWAAWVQLWIGNAVYVHQGRVAEAVVAMRAGIAAMAADSPSRAVGANYLSDLLMRLGRWAEFDAVLDEATSMLVPGQDRAPAYLAWARARGTAARQDAAATRRWIVEAERYLGEWYEGISGVIFLAEAAVLLERVGEPVMSETYLQRALDRDPADELVVQAQAELLARRGDPQEAIAALRRLSTQPWLEAVDVWRHLLLEAWASVRAGHGDVGTLASRAFARADEMGGPAVVTAGEPDLARALAPAAAAVGSAPAAALLAPATGLIVRVLGGSSVHRGIVELRLPVGRSGELVRLLAVSPDGLDVEEVVEALWPEAAPDAGRRHLRHALSRLRTRAGELVRRDGTRLTLGDAWVDARAFRVAADRALAERSEHTVRLALALWTGTPLPADPFASWAVDVREQLVRRLLRLLDLGADAALARGAPLEAVTLLEDAVAVDPYDTSRHERAARLLEGVGRGGAAERLRAQAARRTAELE
jgi:DNA-binding SARP family transcriptional activator